LTVTSTIRFHSSTFKLAMSGAGVRPALANTMSSVP
jgi:hypothetical protein